MYRRSDYDSDSESGPGYYKPQEKAKRSCMCKVLIWTTAILFSLLLLAFLVIWVIFPLVFMNTISLQRTLMFPNFDQPENPQYESYKLYGAKGVKNRYITVKDLYNETDGVSLGVWQVLPADRINATDFDSELRNSEKPICIYFHGNSGTRIYPYPMYQKLREFFHVLAVDYRSYGDSTEALLTEKAVVNDLVQFYYKVLELTNQREVFFWAHSLGTALSTHTLRKITEGHSSAPDRRLPRALMLEAPFTTMREEIEYHPIGKLFAWLPWFDATIRDPLEENGFHFWTTTNILSVNCPIMIVHAKDDSIIPYTLGEKLARIAMTERDPVKQGEVTIHIIPESARCDHMDINKYIELPKFISNFLKDVDEWYNKRTGLKT